MNIVARPECGGGGESRTAAAAKLLARTLTYRIRHKLPYLK
jgi:hypothetical protein